MAKKSILDPRQVSFLSFYLNPKGELYGNALQSALKAGYAQEYAESLTSKMPSWLAENVGNDKMLKKAERNLDEFLDLNTQETKTNEAGNEYIKTNTEILKVKADVTKFVASTVGRYGKENPLDNHPTQTIINIIIPNGATEHRVFSQPKTV